LTVNVSAGLPNLQSTILNKILRNILSFLCFTTFLVFRAKLIGLLPKQVGMVVKTAFQRTKDTFEEKSCSWQRMSFCAVRTKLFWMSGEGFGGVFESALHVPTGKFWRNFVLRKITFGKTFMFSSKKQLSFDANLDAGLTNLLSILNKKVLREKYLIKRPKFVVLSGYRLNA